MSNKGKWIVGAVLICAIITLTVVNICNKQTTPNNTTRNASDENGAVTGVATEVVTGASVSTEAPVVTPTASPMAVEEVINNGGVPIVYDRSYRHMVDKELANYAYIALENVTESVDIDSEGVNTNTGALGAGDYEINTKEKRLKADLTVYSVATGLTTKNTFLVRCDYKKKLFFTKEGNNPWKQYKKHGVRLFNYRSGYSLYDIWYAMVDEKKMGRVIGEQKDNIDTFVYERDAVEDDLISTAFSDYTAFKTKITLTFDSKTHKPLSIIRAVTYGQDEPNGILVNRVVFTNISNKSIKIKAKYK